LGIERDTPLQIRHADIDMHIHMPLPCQVGLRCTRRWQNLVLLLSIAKHLTGMTWEIQDISAIFFVIQKKMLSHTLETTCSILFIGTSSRHYRKTPACRILSLDGRWASRHQPWRSGYANWRTWASSRVIMPRLILPNWASRCRCG